MRWQRENLGLKAASELRRELGDFLTEQCEPDEEAHLSAQVIIGELLSNVARHAPGRLSVEIEWEDRRPVLVLNDAGPGFARDVKLPPLTAETGRGLYIVAALAPRFKTDRLESGGMRYTVDLPMIRKRSD